MKTGKQAGGNNLGKQGQKLSNTTGKPSAKAPTTIIAVGQGYGGSRKSSNRSAGAAGGGMGIGRLGGGRKRGR